MKKSTGSDVAGSFGWASDLSPGAAIGGERACGFSSTFTMSRLRTSFPSVRMRRSLTRNSFSNVAQKPGLARN